MYVDYTECRQIGQAWREPFWGIVRLYAMIKDNLFNQRSEVMKKFVVFIGLIAVLALSACAGAAPNASLSAQNTGPAAAPQQQDANPPLRTITVNGSGQVTLAPDVAYVYIGVNSQSENVGDALTENNTKAEAIANALKELGIDTKDIQTSSFNIYPQQQYGPNGEVTKTVFNVDNTVYVTVRDLQSLGKLLDVVVRSGANTINGITFDVLDKAKATSDARKLAIDSARSQAEEIAQVAGVTLGDLQSIIVSSSNSNPPTPMYDAKVANAGAAQVPVSAGQMVIRVEVNTVYTIR